MPRFMLSDEHWSKLKGMMLQESSDNTRDLRMVVEGMLYRLRVGCAWRDLPTCFGRWNSVYKKFNEWSKKGKWAISNSECGICQASCPLFQATCFKFSGSEIFSFSGLSHTSFSCSQLRVLRPFQRAGLAVLAA